MSRHTLRWSVIGLLVILAGSLAWYKMRPREIAVQVAPVTRGRVEKVVANTRAGTLKACREANLSPGIGGQISVLTVEEGDAVRKGQLLLELWNEDLKAEFILAESELKAAGARASAALLQSEIAGREARRMEQLISDGAISEQEADKIFTEAKVKRTGYEAAETEVQAGRSRLGVIKAKLDRTRLTAPFAGIIAKINGELNEYVTPSPPGIPTPPAIELLDVSCFYVTAPIDEVDAPAVRVGMDARIIMDAFGEQNFAGRVRRIDSFVLDMEKQARTVDVEVEFVNPEQVEVFLAGYSADVEIIVATVEDALQIPTQAILEGNRVFVYDRNGKRLQERTIRVGLSNWDKTQVAEGLQQDEPVVISTDKPGLKAGIPVSITRE